MKSKSVKTAVYAAQPILDALGLAIKPSAVFGRSVKQMARKELELRPAVALEIRSSSPDVYICSGGKTLTTTATRVNYGETLLYSTLVRPR